MAFLREENKSNTKDIVKSQLPFLCSVFLVDPISSVINKLGMSKMYCVILRISLVMSLHCSYKAIIHYTVSL